MCLQAMRAAGPAFAELLLRTKGLNQSSLLFVSTAPMAHAVRSRTKTNRRKRESALPGVRPGRLQSSRAGGPRIWG